MIKQAPTRGRLAVMAVFTVSCFALLLFLWSSFGGPIPLQPKGYRVQVAFPEAAQLAPQADVRVAGVRVGRVTGTVRDPRGNRTLATIQIDPRYAPVAADSRATLRTKAILGETYVELTLGSTDGPRVPDGGRLANRRVGDVVQLDEILDTLDPYTRRAFRTWQQSLARGVRGRGRDLNDAFGTLPGFARSAGDLLEVLDEQRAALRGLVRNTGVVMGALTDRATQLRALVQNTDTVFSAIARQSDAWAQTWQVMPAFLRQSRLTFDRLGRFAHDTDPLVRELKPAIDDLGPTLRSVRAFAPDLKSLVVRMRPLIDISRTSLPATRDVLDGLRPMLGALGPWLEELNPLLAWIGQSQTTLTDMFANLGTSTAAKTKSGDPRAVGHYLRQIGPIGTESVAFYPTRLPTNRGNAYINPLSLISPELAKLGIGASFDCDNAGGDRPAGGVPPAAACRTQKPFDYLGGPKRFPHIVRDDYSKP
jgi:virulence factor Mce-like protein